jgi:hypothetical protein
MISKLFLVGERLENESRRERLPLGVAGDIRDLVGEGMDDGWMAKEPARVWLGIPKAIVSGAPGLGIIVVA